MIATVPRNLSELQFYELRKSRVYLYLYNIPTEISFIPLLYIGTTKAWNSMTVKCFRDYPDLLSFTDEEAKQSGGDMIFQGYPGSLWHKGPVSPAPSPTMTGLVLSPCS